MARAVFLLKAVASIELGGGFRQSDLTTYFHTINAPKPKVSAVSVLGAVNHPGVDQNADGEVMLDVEVAGAVAHGARIVVYFAPNTDQGSTTPSRTPSTTPSTSRR